MGKEERIYAPVNRPTSGLSMVLSLAKNRVSPPAALGCSSDRFLTATCGRSDSRPHLMEPESSRHAVDRDHLGRGSLDRLRSHSVTATLPQKTPPNLDYISTNVQNSKSRDVNSPSDEQ